MKDPIIVVGAGLSGLRTASILISQGIECKIVEARGRIGGRVLSEAAVKNGSKFDLGPTWFWPQHEPVISNLVKELGLRTFTQYTEGAILFEQADHAEVQRHRVPGIERSVRFDGGVQSLIDAVAATLPQGTVQLDTRVMAINMEEEGVITLDAEINGGKKKRMRAGAVILALPPRLVASRITFSPDLPDSLKSSLIDKPTWMAGQAKVVAVYPRPFWREDGLSGQVTSFRGPLQEIHDASPESGDGALFGFFGIPAEVRQSLGKERILELVVNQLTRLFGAEAEKPLSLLYKDWSIDSETAVFDDLKPLSAFPNYGQPSNTDIWGQKIIFAGTESSSEYGGHLEGALRSAEHAVSEVMRLKQIENGNR
ncbi:flavin monoamine oxidase family protein [Bacillus suaedae]|uniref:FAD-dependent oxidoreductase n=1 Tax=Halalkalibacter suaedae TaxID=2822140 RepID=A0A941ARG1_9BACI|nr:FAD-dependent oxidoreductase [Bacillus suaedae]MBP3952513.1 FAD-dependent oxidoreductase [Bacillus suaedae]